MTDTATTAIAHKATLRLEDALAIENALAWSRPFGDCDYILERVRRQYESRLQMLCGQSPGARDLINLLDTTSMQEYSRVLGDPIVRVAIDESVSALRMNGEPFPESDLESVLAFAIDSIRNRSTVPPLAEASNLQLSLRDGHPTPWIWSEQRRIDDSLGQMFRLLISQHHQDFILTTPDDCASEMFVAGARLLSELCPRLAESALRHVHLIAVIESKSSANITSMTNPRIPGVFFLSPAVLTTPWQVAEYLLHEALHVKFLDLENTHSLLVEDYYEPDSPRIRPHWNKVRSGGASEWPVNRVLTVFQVYVHLAVFFTIASARGSVLEDQYGPQFRVADKQARRSLDRAHYLKGQLEDHQAYLDFGGRLFVRWLGDLVRRLDPSPPIAGSYVHLLLDFYERESEQFQDLVAQVSGTEGPSDPLVAEDLRCMAEEELRQALDVVSLMPESANTTARDLRDRYETLRSSGSTAEDWQVSSNLLVGARATVLQYLRALDARLYLEPCSTPNGVITPGELVRGMVEDSSRRVSVATKRVSGVKGGAD